MWEGPCVATLGVFDGIHRGHQALLDQVHTRASEQGAQTLVITFEPHPISVLAPQAPPHRLTALPAKTQLLTELGVDLLWPYPFSRRAASLEPEAFLEQVVARFDLREVWIGYDFRFGKDRRGDAELLRREGTRHHFDVFTFDAVEGESGVYSSTRVREALRAGKIEDAVEVLGHSFWLEGPVVHGRGEGAQLLVPTANVDLDPRQLLPAQGVYAAWADLHGKLVPTALNVGTRPTLTDDRHLTVEAHLIGWSGDLYGRPLRLHLGARIRGEARFDGLAALRAQIDADISAATAWCQSHGLPAGRAR